MKIGIVGPGAMGCLFAYYFNKAGINVALLGKDKEAVFELREGIDLIIADETERFYTNISNDPAILKGCETIFIFVKTYDTEEALREIADVLDKESVVVTLQNGIGNKDIIAKFIEEKQIVYGSTSYGATRINSNTIRLGGTGTNIIGGINPAVVQAVEGILKRAGLEVSVTDEPDIAVWKKAIINAGINPLGALLNIPNGAIINNDFSKRIQEQIVMEAVNVARSVGVVFDINEMVEVTRTVCEKTSGNLCSMLQDRKANRRTEIDSINGIIIEQGRKNSIPVQYNDSVYCLIKAMELS